MTPRSGDLPIPVVATARPSTSRSNPTFTDVTTSTAKADSTPSLTSIDDVVSLIRSVQADVRSVGRLENKNNLLLSTLSKLFHQGKGKGLRILGSQLQGSIEPLAMLSPGESTLGYTFVLAVRTSNAATRDDASVLMPFIASYAREMTPVQLHGAGEIVALLVRGIVNVAQMVHDPVWANPFLIRITDNFCRVQGGMNNLTSLHPVVLYHLIRTAHYGTAVDWMLQYEIISADRQFSPLAYTDVLEYFYYGGLAYSKVEDYERAHSMYEQCVCSPAQHVSAIHIDAYKKLILIQLLWKGKLSPLPQYASQAVKRAIRTRIANLDAYITLSSVFCDPKHLDFRHSNTMQSRGETVSTADEALQVVIDAEYSTFARDRNVGLVKRIARSFLRRRLQCVSSLFASISVGAVTGIVNVGVASSKDDASRAALYAQVVDEINKAHAADWLRATVVSSKGRILTDVKDAVDLRDAIVQFGQPYGHQVSPEAVQELTNIMKDGRKWNQSVYEKERSIAQSETFLSKLSNPTRDRFTTLNVDDLDDDAFA